MKSKSIFQEYKDFFQIVGYILVVYVTYNYFTHGVSALLQNPGFIIIAMKIGIPETYSSWLISLIGILDVLIAMGLLFYRRSWLIFYSGLWPLVPALSGYMVYNTFNFGYLQYPLLAAVIYWIYIKNQCDDPLDTLMKKFKK